MGTDLPLYDCTDQLGRKERVKTEALDSSSVRAGEEKETGKEFQKSRGENQV